MPTSRPRFQVTETPGVERALRIAATAWPDASRSELVTRLFETAADALEGERAAALERRRELVHARAGKFPGVYPDGYLDELREDWPR